MPNPTRTCPVCAAPIWTTPGAGRPKTYCSVECRRIQESERRREARAEAKAKRPPKPVKPKAPKKSRRTTPLTRPCEWCGATMDLPLRSTRRFCSGACQNRAARRRNPPKPRVKPQSEYVVNTGQCTECGAETRSKPGAGRAPLTCSDECRRHRKAARHALHYAGYKTRRLELNDARRRKTREGMTPADIETTIAYRKHLNGKQCAYCDAPSEHIDHLMPVARGGRDWWFNLVPACATCNHRKGIHCETWMRMRARQCERAATAA